MEHKHVMTLTENAVIHAEHLDIGYANQPIVKDFTADMIEGEFIAVLGPNGAGKTTLLKTLLGVLKPLKGTLTVLNHNPHKDCVSLGYMPQRLLTPALSHITGRVLLKAALQGQHLGLPFLSAQQKEHIELCLVQAGALSFADWPFNACSGGQQRLIMLAQALLGNPKLLLLDEPLANLDMRHQEIFVSVLMRLNQAQKISILMTTHDINPLMKAVGRVLYLANGSALLGTLDDVLNTERLSALYQTPVDVLRYQDRYFVMHTDSGRIDNVCH